MKFTKYNNPNKRRKSRKKDYTERSIDAGLAMLHDSSLGYDIPVSTYETLYHLNETYIYNEKEPKNDH